MDKSSRDILAASRLFGCLPAEEIDALAAGAKVVALDKDRVLFSRGDQADSAYVVLAGEISIEIISSEGRIAQFAALGPGSVFGEFALLDNGLRAADARARVNSRVLRIDEAQFRRIAATYIDFAQAIITDLIEKLRTTNSQFEGVAFRGLRARLAQLLLGLAESAEGASSIRITQSEIADRISATREKVNMHLQAMRAAGAIALHRGQIDFVDLSKLADFVEDS